MCRKKSTFITPWPSWQRKILQFVVWVRNPLKNSQTSSFHVRLDLSCWYLFHQLALHQSLWVEASPFPEACVSERPTFLISWFSMMSFVWIPSNWKINIGHFELLEDHHDIQFVDFDQLPQFMQVLPFTTDSTLQWSGRCWLQGQINIFLVFPIRQRNTERVTHRQFRFWKRSRIDIYMQWNDASVTAEHHSWEFFSCTACPCKFSSGQLRLSDGIGSKCHV